MKNLNERIAALETLTEEKAKYNYDLELFELENGETYKVLTDEEADEAAAEEIKNSLWAFRPEFIVEHMKNFNTMYNYEKKTIIEAIEKMQADLCESANTIVEALIEDIDDFVYDAIKVDGRGHFIAWYDFNENEQNDYFIYRID